MATKTKSSEAKREGAVLRDSESVDAAYDAGLEWLHCGRCFEYDHAVQCPVGSTPRAGALASTHTTFYVTNCAHLACDTCMQQDNPGGISKNLVDSRKDHVCPVCGQRALIVELITQVPEEVEKIFVPAVVHLEDALKVWKLQYGNAVRLIRHLKLKTADYSRKYGEATRALQKAKEEMKRQRHEMELYKQNASSKDGSSGRQRTPNTYVSPSPKAAGAASNKRPSSSRSINSSPSTSGGRHIRTPQGPLRLSLPPRTRESASGINGTALNSQSQQPHLTSSAYQFDPMDIQGPHANADMSGQFYEEPMHNTTGHHVDNLMFSQNASDVPAAQAFAAYPSPRDQWIPNTTQFRERNGTPTNQQHLYAQQNRGQYVPNTAVSLTYQGNARPSTAINARPGTAMRQPFQARTNEVVAPNPQMMNYSAPQMAFSGTRAAGYDSRPASRSAHPQYGNLPTR
ncbi:hypothetical protein DFJ77DRAFT_468512 [Powellomyces hirtus]|nr:hypothetical protein DFJ77DRAFT_468512 [Powellomyces hirtus]